MRRLSFMLLVVVMVLFPAARGLADTACSFRVNVINNTDDAVIVMSETDIGNYTLLVLEQDEKTLDLGFSTPWMTESYTGEIDIYKDAENLVGKYEMKVTSGLQGAYTCINAATFTEKEAGEKYDVDMNGGPYQMPNGCTYWAVDLTVSKKE